MRRHILSSLLLCLGLFADPSRAITLEEALDATGVAVFTTSGDAPWFGQSAVSHDGGDAAQSGSFVGDGQSTLETTFGAPTDGYLSFWWRISEGDSNASLEFLVDEAAGDWIDGESGWRRKVFPLSAGSHSLRWTYTKYWEDSPGAGAGWVDQFAFSAEPPVIEVTVRAPDAPGVAVQSSPPDEAGQTGGPTPFTLHYPFGTDVKLTAAEVPDRMVKRWQGCAQDGADPFVCRLNVSGEVGGVTLSYTAPLAVGLDAPGWLFESSGGPGRWRTLDNDGGYYGADSAYAFAGTGETVWIQTAQTFSPSGYIVFSWQVDAWGGGSLDFYLDGAATPTLSIDGWQYWQQVVLPVGAGLHTLRWELRGGDYPAEGWLKGVRFTTESFSYPLEISSTTLPVEIVADPPDLYYRISGVTPFALHYEHDALNPVILTAPPAPDGFLWSGWRGCDFVQGARGEQCAVAMTSAREVIADYAITLANALDQPDWSIDTDPEQPWAGDGYGHDGADSAVSAVETGESSWIQASVDFAEAGYLTFWWAIEAWGTGTLEFFLDGSPTPAASIDDSQYWRQVVVPIASAGPHTLRWLLTGGDDEAYGRVDSAAFSTVRPVYGLRVTADDEVDVTAEPPDADGKTGGTTPFTLRYPWSPTDEVTLTAPALEPGYSWLWQGCDRTQGTHNAECVVVVVGARDISVRRAATLAAAIDQPGWTVDTGGFAPWRVSDWGHDGVDSAYGEAEYGASSWMQTSPEFAAPGTLTFWWSVDAWGTGTLDLHLDGSPTPVASISGWQDWSSASVHLPPGRHTLRWEVHGGDDYTEARVDEVVFTPAGTAVAFASQGTYDGWVRESHETSGRGESSNTAATTLLVGDDALDRQYRGILSFNTAALPDDATIIGALLRIRRDGYLGASPFVTHGALTVDVRRGAFSGRAALQAEDFQAAASLLRAGSVGRLAGAGSWHSATLAKGALPSINPKGITQLRLRFAKDDNDDASADAVRFWSGNAAAGSRPQLVVTYTVP